MNIARKEAIEKGVRWLERFLVDEGNGGIKEGIAHNIDSDGKYTVLDGVRTDCTGESAGAFKMYAYLSGEKEYAALAGKMEKIVYGPMFTEAGGSMVWCDGAPTHGMYVIRMMWRERCCLDCMMLCIWEIVLMWKISVAQWIF